MTTSSHPKAPAGTFRRLASQLPPLEPLGDEPLPIEERVLASRKMSVGTPSKPLLGLPLRRWIPQDCHSFMDYGNGLVAAGLARGEGTRAEVMGLTLASLVIGVSAVTDYRISVAKLVPIEVHEIADYVWAATAIAAPFVLGYWKKSPRAAIAHVALGVGTILSSLLTDYRAYSHRTRRSQRAAR